MEMMSSDDNSYDSDTGDEISRDKDSTDQVFSDSGVEDVERSVDSPLLYDVVFKEKSEFLKNDLKLLNDEKHVKYNEDLKKLELQKEIELENCKLKKQLEYEAVDREYKKQCQQIIEDNKNQIRQLQETLIAELKEKKKNILNEKQLMELQSDPTDHMLLLSRKLRRRPNDPVTPPVPQEKRKKFPLFSNNYFMLQDFEIAEDSKAIQELANVKTTAPVNAIIKYESSSSSSSKKPELYSSTDYTNFTISDTRAIPTTRIESGKLLFEKKWYHRGQPIYVEGPYLGKFPAIIYSIAKETIWVKKTLDNNKFRFTVSCLSNGKISITRRAAV